MTLQDAKEAIDRYVEHGIPCGGFLTSVLENDLMGAMSRADNSSRSNLHAICQYVYNDIPSNVHGSRERVKAHLETFLFRAEAERAVTPAASAAQKA